MPWSWLIDYFGNIGDFLEASGGRLPYKVRDMCIMYHSVDKIAYQVTRVAPADTATVQYWDDLTFTQGFNLTEAKQRSVSEFPTPRLMFRKGLTPFQTNILTALGLAQSLRRIG